MKNKLRIIGIAAAVLVLSLTGCPVDPDDGFVDVTGVELNEHFITMLQGSTVTLTATVMPDNASDKGVTWHSSSDWLVTVDDNGVLTASTEEFATGDATITVTTNIGGGHTDVCYVTVIAPVAVEDITMDVAAVTLEKEMTFQLDYTITPSGATNQNVTWSSNNTAVATVSDSGVVTAVADGTATITVTTADGGHSATCTVTVVEFDPGIVRATGITLDQTELTLSVDFDRFRQLNYTIEPVDVDYDIVSWSSSNTAVATVADGIVTAHSPGTATITATPLFRANDSVQATCTVTVSPPEYKKITIYNIDSRYGGGTIEVSVLDFIALAENEEDIIPAEGSSRIEYRGGGYVAEMMLFGFDAQGHISGGWNGGGDYHFGLIINDYDGEPVAQYLYTNGANINMTDVRANPRYVFTAGEDVVIDFNKFRQVEHPVQSVALQTDVWDDDDHRYYRVPAETITLDLINDQERTLFANIWPPVAYNKEVTRSSSDANVVEVGGWGNQVYVYARGPGTATITATTVDGGHTATCTVTVNELAPLTEFDFWPYENNLILWETTADAHIGHFSDGWGGGGGYVGGLPPYNYTLVSGAGDADNNLFRIENMALLVGAAALPSAREYSIRVQLADSSTPPKTITKACTFTVRDTAPDNPPSAIASGQTSNWQEKNIYVYGTVPNSEGDGGVAVVNRATNADPYDPVVVYVNGSYFRFTQDIPAGTDVSSWFHPTIAGLSYTLRQDIVTYSPYFTVEITGIPTEATTDNPYGGGDPVDVTIKIPHSLLLDMNGYPSITSDLVVQMDKDQQTDTDLRFYYNIYQYPENVCRIGTVRYTNLQAAIDAAGETPTTITVYRNVEVGNEYNQQGIHIAQDQHITLVAETDGVTIKSTSFLYWYYSSAVLQVRGTLILGNGGSHTPRLIVTRDEDDQVQVANLINCLSGHLVLNNGAEIRSIDNRDEGVTIKKDDYSMGGDGTFTMHGGVIAGCSTGVSLSAGTFIMNGGIIYGNNEGANSNGISISIWNDSSSSPHSISGSVFGGNPPTESSTATWGTAP